MVYKMNYALQSSGSFDLTTTPKLTSPFILGGFLIKYLILNAALRSLALYGQLEAEKHQGRNSSQLEFLDVYS